MKPFLFGAFLGMFVLQIITYHMAYQAGFHAGVMHELLRSAFPF